MIVTNDCSFAQIQIHQFIQVSSTESLINSFISLGFSGHCFITISSTKLIFACLNFVEKKVDMIKKIKQLELTILQLSSTGVPPPPPIFRLINFTCNYSFSFYAYQLNRYIFIKSHYRLIFIFFYFDVVFTSLLSSRHLLMYLYFVTLDLFLRRYVLINSYQTTGEKWRK